MIENNIKYKSYNFLLFKVTLVKKKSWFCEFDLKRYLMFRTSVATDQGAPERLCVVTSLKAEYIDRTEKAGNWFQYTVWAAGWFNTTQCCEISLVISIYIFASFFASTRGFFVKI